MYVAWTWSYDPEPPWELMIYQPYMAKLSENEVSLSR